MIISISVAPNVDTLVVAQTMAEKYGLVIHEDPARVMCEQYGFQTIYDMPVVLQKQVRKQLISDHLDLLAHQDNLLLNYSIIQWLADWMRWFWHTTPSQEWTQIMETAKQCVQKYQSIYHLQDNVNRAYDGYVWLDKENSKQINSLMLYLYAELGISDQVKYEVES